MGPPDQPDFVNAVAGLLTRCRRHELLAALQAIEAPTAGDGTGPAGARARSTSTCCCMASLELEDER
jgi:7,8-dihydro-6-hydroxymethylpterin-pyrophosphokinase